MWIACDIRTNHSETFSQHFPNWLFSAQILYCRQIGLWESWFLTVIFDNIRASMAQKRVPSMIKVHFPKFKICRINTETVMSGEITSSWQNTDEEILFTFIFLVLTHILWQLCYSLTIQDHHSTLETGKTILSNYTYRSHCYTIHMPAF